MNFKIFGYTVSIEKDNGSQYYVSDNITYMTYSYAKKTVLKRLGIMCTKEEILAGGIPAIKALRDIVRNEYGYPLSLKQAKEFVEEYFDYYGKGELK